MRGRHKQKGHKQPQCAKPQCRRWSWDLKPTLKAETLMGRMQVAKAMLAGTPQGKGAKL